MSECRCKKPKTVEVVVDDLEGETVIATSTYYLCDRCSGLLP